MNCFNHEEIDAVAICPVCGRGLCKSCSRSFENYIVCGDECLNILNRNKALMDASINRQNKKTKAEVFFLFLLGGIFGFFGVFTLFYLHYLGIYLGVFLLAASSAFAISGFKYKQANNKVVCKQLSSE